MMKFKTFSSHRCAENECTAAFTTKQCLQFHYKKVHGFTQEQMPKIERSVAYTFDAYSGGLKNEALGKHPYMSSLKQFKLKNKFENFRRHDETSEEEFG